MRIAVASTGLDVAWRFDVADSFTFYTVNLGIISDCQCMPSLDLPLEKLAATLKELDVTALICGAINVDSAEVFCKADIEVVAGAQGAARELVEQYLTRTLIGVDEMCRDDEESCCD